MGDRHKSVRVYASGNSKRKAAKEKQELFEKEISKNKRIKDFFHVPSSSDSRDETDMNGNEVSSGDVILSDIDDDENTLTWMI